LPASIAGEEGHQNLRVLMRDIDKHGSSEKKRFLAEVLNALRRL
jgi:hypothetical protein